MWIVDESTSNEEASRRRVNSISTIPSLLWILSLLICVSSISIFPSGVWANTELHREAGYIGFISGENAIDFREEMFHEQNEAERDFLDVGVMVHIGAVGTNHAPPSVQLAQVTAREILLPYPRAIGNASSQAERERAIGSEDGVYKWRDNAGVMQFTNMPPPSSCTSPDCNAIAKMKRENQAVIEANRKEGQRIKEAREAVKEVRRKEEPVRVEVPSTRKNDGGWSTMTQSERVSGVQRMMNGFVKIGTYPRYSVGHYVKEIDRLLKTAALSPSEAFALLVTAED